MIEKDFILFGEPESILKTNNIDIKIAPIVINTISNDKEYKIYNFYKGDFNGFLTNECDILFKKGDNIIKLDFPKYFKNNLVSYINKKGKIEKREKSGVSYVDCIDFSSYMVGITANIRNKLEKVLAISPCIDPNKTNDENLETILDIGFVKNIKKKIGDIFTIINTKEVSGHDIIYIGNELYISKFGNDNIYISNIEEILKLYPSNIIGRKKSFFIQGNIGKNIKTKFKNFSNIRYEIIKEKELEK